MPWPAAHIGIRAKVVAGAAAALAPWLVHALTATANDAIALPLLLAFSALCLWQIARWLRPIADIAAALRSCEDSTDDDGAGARPLAGMAGLAAATVRLVDRVNALEHRWVQRHALTGLPTRESFLAAMEDDLGGGTPILVGAIRLADYKRLFAFDPAAAETALKSFAERLVASLGKSRPVAHVDRDCFAIWFRGIAADAARTELAALCYALTAEIQAGEIRIIPELEVGAALFPDDGVAPAALLNHALVSLVRSGGDGAIAAPARPAGAARERFTLAQDLRHAIERQQLELHFQPVVDLAKGALVGAEALLRWHHPEAGLVSPGRFIPILEDADLIDEIGLWTLNAACREVRGWRRRGLDQLKVAVNLSALQLRDVDLVDRIGRTLERHHLPPGALELELTETATTEDAAGTLAVFGALRDLGVSLAIDDFGSGYSSLSYLKNLPFNKLKIDREFVTDIHQRRDSQAICQALVALTRGLGLEILAEGVERVEEVEMLQVLGCNMFQGYYFSRPLTANDFIRYAFDPATRAQFQLPIGRDPPSARLTA